MSPMSEIRKTNIDPNFLNNMDRAAPQIASDQARPDVIIANCRLKSNKVEKLLTYRKNPKHRKVR